ncbi:twin-arginine translocation signal domain-containing protein [Azospirillum sp. ST 5-10]|uniref:twin-arginine translocation signal domain-containing protein n=1 Tax=unclassified Azospirillum TaxID=2630922 RepID=UPI003F49FF40
MSHESSRRGFLRAATALAAGGVCGSLAVPAVALTPLSGSDYGAVLDSACGASAEHARLVEETATALGRPASDPLVQAVLQRTVCPLCGCAVVPTPAAAGGAPF